MLCHHCKTELNQVADSGQTAPNGMEPNAMAEMATLKHRLTQLRGRLSGDLRCLEQRLDQVFCLVGEQFDALESKRRLATVSIPKSSPKTAAEAPAPAAAPAAPAVMVPPNLIDSLVTEMAPTPVPSEERNLTTPRRGPDLVSPRSPQTPNSLDVLAELHIGQKWLLIVGIAVTVLGVGFFLKYSFDKNWISPAGRIALTYLAGALCLGTGEAFRRLEIFHGFGLALMGGGLAIFYFSGFAAFQIYSLISRPIAFGLLASVTLLAGLLAYVHNAKWLAIIGLIGGFITPVILRTGAVHPVNLMTYMAVLNLAVLVLARVRAWRLLTTLGFLFTWLIFSSWFFPYYSNEKFWPTTLFLNLFYLIHFLSPLAYSLRPEEEISALDFRTTLPNAFIAFGFSYYTISRYASTEHVGFVTLAYALMAAGLALWLHQRQIEDERPFAMLLAHSVLFLIITVPIIFSQYWITVFWAAQAAALMWAARRLDIKEIDFGLGASILLSAALGKLYVYDYSVIFKLGPGLIYYPDFAAMFVERWLTLAATFAALAATAVYLPASRFKDRPLHLGLFVTLLFVSLSLETSAYFGEKAPMARFAALSVFWGIFAVTLLVIGFFRNYVTLRKAGLGLFGLTVVKVFLVDMANLSTPFRVVSFMGLGVLLIGASFLYYYNKDRLLYPATDQQPVS